MKTLQPEDRAVFAGSLPCLQEDRPPLIPAFAFRAVLHPGRAVTAGKSSRYRESASPLLGVKWPAGAGNPKLNVTNSPWTVKSHLRFCAVALARIVAENIKRTRIALGFSQEQLAARAGLDRTYVSGVERAVRNPTLRIIEQIADALNTSASDLMRDPKQDQKKMSHRKR